MTALAQIEETLSKLTPGELNEVQTMLGRLKTAKLSSPGSGGGKPGSSGGGSDGSDRPTFDEIKPLLEKPESEVTEEELEKIERYNGFKCYERGSPALQ